MSLLPERIRDLSFWHYQIAGWLSMAVLQTSITSITIGRWDEQILSGVLLQVALGFLLTTLLRYFYRRVRYQGLSLSSMIALIGICSAAVTVILAFCIPLLEHVSGGSVLAESYGRTIGVMLFLAYAFPDKLAWSALYFGIKFWREWQDEREQTERATEEAQRAQLQMLRYQLNPRFLFNALDLVRLLVDENPHGARQAITDLSEFLRYSLMSRKRSGVPLKEELDAVRLFLSIEQRQAMKLEVSYEIAEDTQEVVLPSFLVYSLVEHALPHKMQMGALSLRMKICTGIADNTLRISVACSGRALRAQGPRSDQREKTGLEQVEARLRELVPGRHQLSCRQDAGNTVLTLELPLTNGAAHEDTLARDYHRR